MLVSKRCVILSKWGKFLHSWGKRCAMRVGQVHVRWGKLPRRVALQIALPLGFAVEVFSFWKGESGEPCSVCSVCTMGKANSLDLSTDFCNSAFHGGSVSPHAKCINFNGHQ